MRIPRLNHMKRPHNRSFRSSSVNRRERAIIEQLENIRQAVLWDNTKGAINLLEELKNKLSSQLLARGGKN